ncbi:MAG: hypothetical protein HYY93_04690 [Planctomycetes bacterium]|nr:hypothetical protein [Planctomycetota bacterium]
MLNRIAVAVTLLACLAAGCRSAGPRVPAKAPSPPQIPAAAPEPAPAVLSSNPNAPAPSLDRIEVVDAARLCYGDPKDFTRAAEMDVSKAFGEVREWRLISVRRLTPEDPEYWLLLDKANIRFHRAVHAIASTAGFDLVADLGALRRYHEDVLQPLPDLTSPVLEALRASEQIDDLHLSIALLRR